jgi:hypothetical protein
MKTKELKTLLQKSYNEDSNNVRSHIYIASHLLKYDGMPLSKRLRLPDDLQIVVEHGMYYIVNTNSNFDIKHLVSWDGIVNLEIFNTKSDTCHYSGAIERLEKLDVYLNNETEFNKLLKKLNNVEKAYKLLQKEVKEFNSNYDNLHFPAYYEVLCSVFGDKYGELIRFFR